MTRLTIVILLLSATAAAETDLVVVGPVAVGKGQAVHVRHVKKALEAAKRAPDAHAVDAACVADPICLDKVGLDVGAKRLLAVSTAGDDTIFGDDSPLESMVEPGEGKDPRRRELVAYLGALDAEEQVNLLALILLGRGDFSLDEWEDALATARDGIEDKSADFLIGDPALPGYLLEGLESFGESCD